MNQCLTFHRFSVISLIDFETVFSRVCHLLINSIARLALYQRPVRSDYERDGKTRNLPSVEKGERDSKGSAGDELVFCPRGRER